MARAIVSNISTDPTALSDVEATRLGYKTYISGTAYNNGIKPTITSTLDGASLNAEFIPYQAQNGSWRIKGNIPARSVSVFNTAIGTAAGTAAGSNVLAIAQQDDGKILVGGGFTTWDGTAGRNRLVRLNSNGSLDTAFQTNIGTAANSSVNSIAIQSTGKIVITGSFTTWNGAARPLAIVCLNQDGTEDVSFYTNISSAITGMSPMKTLSLSSDKIILFGAGAVISGVNYNYIKINSDGTLDPTFFKGRITGGNGTDAVWDMRVDSSGNLYIFADCTSIITQAGTQSVNTNGGGTQYHGIAKVDANNASIDTTFRTNWSSTMSIPLFDIANFNTGSVMCIDNSNSKFVFAYAVNLYSCSFTGVVSATDTQTTPTGGGVSCITLQSDGKFIVGGNFTTIGGVAGRNRLARLNSNLTVDTTFSTNLGTGVGLSVVQVILILNYTDGFLIGGLFTTVSGVTKNNIAKILSTGAIQPTTNTTNTDAINGVVFNAAGNQAVSTTLGAAQTFFSQVVASTGGVITTSTTAISSLGTSFDVELNSKPTWAY
jgi:uncharacterized delta-60 repeat protein